MIDRKIDAKPSYVVLAVLAFITTALIGTANAKPQKEPPGGGKPSSEAAILVFKADSYEVDAGGTVLLSWASENTKNCSASGSWEGKQPQNGTYRTPPLNAAASFTLKCNGGGGVTESISITVANPTPEPAPEEPAPEPTPVSVNLTADPSSIVQGEVATLSWSSSGATACQASGDWTGAREPSGSMYITGLSADGSFQIECSGDGGTATDAVVISVASAPEEPAPEPVPVAVNLAAEPSNIVEGEIATLTWNSSGATTCQASGDWLGERELSGSEYIAGLSTDGSFQIECTGDGGTASASTTISVTPPPAEPKLNLWAAEPSVYEGAGTALSWHGEAVSNCQASGSWSGPRATTGEEFVGPIYGSQNYQLTCDGPDGPIVAMTTVSASAGGVSVSWVPPSENVDGSPLGDLLEYRIYVGVQSGTYQEVVNVPDPAATSHFLNAAPGSYYVAVTAVDMEGNESAFSNEVLKTVQ